MLSYEKVLILLPILIYHKMMRKNDDVLTRLCVVIVYQVTCLNLMYEFIVQPTLDSWIEELVSVHLAKPVVSSVYAFLKPFGMADKFREILSKQQRVDDQSLSAYHRRASRVLRWASLAVLIVIAVLIGISRGVDKVQIAWMFVSVGLIFLFIGCLQYLALVNIVMKFTPVCASDIVEVSKQAMLTHCLDTGC